MKWWVMLELVGPDGIVGVHEVGGRAAVAEYAPQMIGLTLEEGKHLFAALRVHLFGGGVMNRPVEERFNVVASSWNQGGRGWSWGWASKAIGFREAREPGHT